MKGISWFLTAAITTAIGSTAFAAEVVRTEDFSLDVGGRLQLLGLAQRLEDPVRDDTRMYMFIRQARLGINGHFDGFKYRVTLGFAGEDEARASPGVSLGLLDMYADVPLYFLGNTHLRVGQFKIPYSLERLSDPGTLAFSDRSIQNVAFRMGRDYGVALHSNIGNVKGAVGVFSGGGRDVPERYIPLILGVPMVVARLGFDNGLYENAFAEKSKSVEGTRVGGFVNAFYLKDSQIGHSTVLNVRLGERSLLINPNWNPYLTKTPTSRGELWEVGGDGAARIPVGIGAVTAEAEINHGRYDNEHGSLRISGGRAQLGFSWKAVEGTIRYAAVLPDRDMTSGGVTVAGGRLINEVTPGITYTYSRNVRVLLDVPVLVNAAVVHERNVGTYVLTDHPDQASLLKTPTGATEAPGTAERMNVVAARLMFQGSF